MLQTTENFQICSAADIQSFHDNTSFSIPWGQHQRPFSERSTLEFLQHSVVKTSTCSPLENLNNKSMYSRNLFPQR